jgi:hypothetical protein
MKRGGVAAAILAAFIVAISASLAGAHARTAARATEAPAYCPIPTVQDAPWGFRVGEEITAPTGTYAHGHGDINLVKKTVNGIICQVDRVRGQPDRQIMLSIEPHLVSSSHRAHMWGVEGNVIKIDVRVKSSTDPECAIGTKGEVTIFASYNGVHQDSVQFSFPTACKRHRHLYHSADVITNVPPE